MKRRNSQSGHTLIEILIAGLIMTLLGTALWTLLRSTYNSQYEVMGQNTANLYARQAIDELADNLRGSKGLTAATVSAITFTDNSGNSIRYWRNESTLRKSVNGSPSSGTVIVNGIDQLAFVYWLYSNGAWSSSTAPSTPANVKAVDFSVRGTMNGSTRQMSGSVRIRQKP
jgi:type II secretory pathway pseudopilin PulG